MRGEDCPVCGAPSAADECPRCGERRRFVDPRIRTAFLLGGLALVLLGLAGAGSLAFLGILTGHFAQGWLACSAMALLAGVALVVQSRRG